MSPQVSKNKPHDSGFARKERRAGMNFAGQSTLRRLRRLRERTLDRHSKDERYFEDQYELLEEVFDALEEAILESKFGRYELQKLYEAIEKAFAMPASGGGGQHTALLGLANVIARTGIEYESCVQFVSGFVHGDREVTEREVEAAVDRAVADYEEGKERRGSKFSGSTRRHTRRRRGITEEGLEQYLEIVKRSPKGLTMEDLQAASPKDEIPEQPLEQQKLLIRALYKRHHKIYLTPNEMLKFEDQQQCFYTRGKWLAAMNLNNKAAQELFPRMCYTIINPITGEVGKTSEGKDSYRCDNTIAEYLYCLVEFDDHGENEALRKLYTLENQLRFWAGFDLYPIAALVFSGNKSIHGWLKLPTITTQAEWDKVVKGEIYTKLEAMGCDKACSNPSRFTRFPGAKHQKTKLYSQLLWLDPSGGKVEL